MAPLDDGPAPTSAPCDFDIFEGPEKTLTLCFKSRRIAAKSLRLIPQETWADVLKHAKCEILSVVHSAPVTLVSKDKEKVFNSRGGMTAYLLSESSLMVSDTSLVLKTCGRTTPLAALEPILDLVLTPVWRKKDPDQYLRYATFTRLGYMRPCEQLEPHTSWEQEVAYMDNHFIGEAVVLGSETTSQQHVYVANYLPKGEFCDAVSTQVALTNLDTSEGMRRYGLAQDRSSNDSTPLKTAWKDLHGDDGRSVAAKDPHLDECFFEPIGYSSNGVFGKHFTTIHITPQPECSYLSVESTMPMTKEGRQRFASAAQGLCSSDTIAVTELVLCPTLFSGGAPEVPSFELRRSTQTVGTSFACAHHHYERGSMLGQRPSAANFVFDHGEVPEVPSAKDLSPVMIQVPSGALAAISAAQKFLSHPGQLKIEEPVALLDLAVLRARVAIWHRLLPRVAPFYAVKCNPNPAIVKALWEMWKVHGMGGFDCASPAEIGLVMQLGVSPAEDIVFANPCKQASSVRFARTMGVFRLVFDNAAELVKIADNHPEAELLLRVQTDDVLAQCPLSSKFGASPAECAALLAQARELDLKVIGVSFHVGSGCSKRGAFRDALGRARAVFNEAVRVGYEPDLLDIGGGFPGWDEDGEATFADHAADITELLEELFPSPQVRIIAEPGRFFVASAQAMLTTCVSAAEASHGNRYYLNDGLYGSFNCLLYDHASVPMPVILRNGRPLEEASDGLGELRKCTLFGPTCDGFDVISDSLKLPQLRVGDQLLFPNMGAYTTAASTNFNGFGSAACFVYDAQCAA